MDEQISWKDTVLREEYIDALKPKTPAEFQSLKIFAEMFEKKIGSYEPVGHPTTTTLGRIVRSVVGDKTKQNENKAWPKYSEHMKMKWKDIIKLDEVRRKIAQNKNSSMLGTYCFYINMDSVPDNEIDDKIKTISRVCIHYVPQDFGAIFCPVFASPNSLEIIEF